MTLHTNVSRLVRRFANREDGAVAIIVALMLPITFGVLALVEASRVYSVKNQLQITADAAALASVREVSGGLAPVQVKAVDFAHRNMPISEQYGDVLLSEDVELGLWESTERTFTSIANGGDPPNAVQVTTRTEMPLLFIAVLRSVHDAFSDTPTSFSPVAEAIALYRLDKCYLNGFVAGGIVEMRSQNHFDADYCVYGRAGVKMNNSNDFAPGTEVGMLNLSNLDAGGNNPGLLDALVKKDISAPATGRADQLIDDLLDGHGPIPDYITRWETVAELPSDPQPGTMYHVTEPDIRVSGDSENFGIVSDHSISVRSNSKLLNVLLASRQSVAIRSNVIIGDEDFCTTGAGQSLIISGGAVSDKEVSVDSNSNIDLHGVQMVSDGSIEMNSNLTITGASLQATGDIKFNSSFEVAGCPDGTHANATGDGTMVSVLVN